MLQLVELIILEDIEKPTHVGGDSYDYYKTPANPAYVAIPKGKKVITTKEEWERPYLNLDVIYKCNRYGIMRNQCKLSREKYKYICGQ